MNRLVSLQQLKQLKSKPLDQVSHIQLTKKLNKFKLDPSFKNLTYRYQFVKQKIPFVLQKMSKIGTIADEIDHHPDWTFRQNHLQIKLSTHDIGNNVSIKDYVLATWIENVLSQPSLQQQLCKKWNGSQFGSQLP